MSLLLFGALAMFANTVADRYWLLRVGEWDRRTDRFPQRLRNLLSVGFGQSRMLYDREAGWDLVLVGHDRSFAARKGFPDYLAAIDLAINEAWLKGLAGLSDDVLEQSLADSLDKRRRSALAGV